MAVVVWSWDASQLHTTTAIIPIIPNDSCHPSEQKLAAIRYFLNRINTYDIGHAEKQKETEILKQIFYNNKLHNSTFSRIRNSKTKPDSENQRKIWAKFTYVGKETRRITKLFKNINLRIELINKNNIGKLLNSRDDQKPYKYEKNGVCQLKCPTCHKKYIGQTGRPFRMRFHEHCNDYKYANNKSKFAQHVLNEGHSFGPMINIMD